MIRTSVVLGIGIGLLAAAVGLVVLAAAPVGSAATAAARAAAEPGSIFFGTGDSDAKTLALIGALREKARNRGVVRVVAGLRMAVRPEQRLAPDEAALQAQQLLRMQQAVAVRVLGRASGDDIVAFPYIPYISLFVDAVQLDRLLDDPDVVSVEEDVPFQFTDDQSNELIHAPDVWRAPDNDTGEGQTIAILDTGVAACAPSAAGCPIVPHPALAGRVVAEACYSTATPKFGVASFCPGQAIESTLYYSGVNCPYPAIKACAHGTGVASVAAADGGVLMGVAHGAKIISIKIASEGLTKAACGMQPIPCATGYETNVISGLMHVYALREQDQFRIAAVNLSVAGGLYDGNCDNAGKGEEQKILRMAAAAVRTVRGADIAVVAGAGNNGAFGKIGAPACLSGATAVAWSDENTSTYVEGIDKDSNFSSLVQVAAPGTNILHAVPGGGYHRDSGTSLATPSVAGAFALLRAAKSDASVGEMEAALACTGKPVAGQTLWKPRIDLIGAYDYLLRPGAATRSWNFSDPQQAFDWLPLAGVWKPNGGQYVVMPAVGPAITMTADPNNSLQKNACGGDSFTVEATVTRAYPDDPHATTFPGTGVYFKYSFLDDTGYYFNYAYQTDVKSPLLPGLLSVFRLDGTAGATELCFQQATKDSPFTVNLTAPNTLKVVSTGISLQFILNGTPVCQDLKSDPTYFAGALAIGSQFLQTAGNSFSISKVSVQSPTSGAVRQEADDTIDPAGRFPAVHPTPGITVVPTPSGVVYVIR